MAGRIPHPAATMKVSHDDLLRKEYLMTDDLRAILRAAAEVPPPLLKYGPEPHRYRRHPGLLLLASGRDFASGEHAALVIDPITPDQFFLSTSEFFGEGQAFSVTLEAGIAEPLESDLQRQGWELAEEEPALVLPRLPSTFPSAPAGIEIVRVHDEETLAAFRSITHMSPRTIPPLVAASDPAVALLVGYLDGEPITTGRLGCLGTVAEVNSITTVPRFERRGLGTAMTWAVLAEGARRGCVSAMLTATPMGYPVYVRMGFQPVGVFRTYIPHVSPVEQEASGTPS
jgi:GNAT superfamily N-acetyltransferase